MNLRCNANFVITIPLNFIILKLYYDFIFYIIIKIIIFNLMKITKYILFIYVINKNKIQYF
jgi:hypothetical protein